MITERLYQFMDTMGYLHPLHPALTHIPVGLVFAAFVLSLLGLVFRHDNMGRAARYCATITLVFLFPTVLLGYLDWQHYYAGGWLQPVRIKIILTIILFFLVCAALMVSRRQIVSWHIVVIYGLSFLSTVGLGYFGGQLVYTGKTPPAAPQFQNGARLYRANCSGCHPYGGNIVDPNAPVRNSPELKELKTFLRWIRDPRLDSGAKGIMPPFVPSRISDGEAEQLWVYISQVMETSKKSETGEIIPADLKVKTDPESIKRGSKLFATNCSGCHTVDNTTTLIGPGLKGILKRQTLPASGRPATPAGIYRQLRLPFKEMPSFAQKLTDDQVFDITAFLNGR